MDRELLEKENRDTVKTFTDNSEPPPVSETEPTEARELAVESAQRPLHLKLQPPIEFDGKTYAELRLDFDSMTGKDFIRAEREFTHRYKPDKNEMPLPELKHLYHQIIAAHLADVPLGLIQKLPRRYYVPLRQECLKACGSSPDEESQ